MLGGLLGGGIALIPNISAGTGDQDAAKIRAIILSVAGSVLGYHLSASPVYESNGFETHSMNSNFDDGLDLKYPNISRDYFKITILSVRF